VTLAAFEIFAFSISKIQKMLIKYLPAITFLDPLAEFTNGLRLPKQNLSVSSASKPAGFRHVCLQSWGKHKILCVSGLYLELSRMHCHVACTTTHQHTSLPTVEIV
jgi:hypothetical protein